MSAGVRRGGKAVRWASVTDDFWKCFWALEYERATVWPNILFLDMPGSRTHNETHPKNVFPSYNNAVTQLCKAFSLFA